MDKKFLDIIYYFEHVFLPQTLFSEDYDLIGTIVRKPEENTLFNVFDAMCDERKEKNPFTPDQFKAEEYHIRDGWYALDITFPQPPMTPLCYAMYIFYKADGTEKGCYTLESGKSESGIQCGFLCQWKADGSHVNYGTKSLETTAADILEEAFRIHTGLSAREEK